VFYFTFEHTSDETFPFLLNRLTKPSWMPKSPHTLPSSTEQTTLRKMALVSHKNYQMLLASPLCFAAPPPPEVDECVVPLADPLGAVINFAALDRRVEDRRGPGGAQVRVHACRQVRQVEILHQVGSVQLSKKSLNEFRGGAFVSAVTIIVVAAVDVQAVKECFVF
jgi:hypothetical protein